MFRFELFFGLFLLIFDSTGTKKRKAKKLSDASSSRPSIKSPKATTGSSSRKKHVAKKPKKRCWPTVTEEAPEEIPDDDYLL